MKKKLRTVVLLLMVALMATFVISCGGGSSEDSGSANSTAKQKEVKKELIFADASWDSIRVHNVIAKIILEEGYGYTIEVVPGSSPNLMAGQVEGDINVFIENWPDNYYEIYYGGVESGDLVEVGLNFNDNAQGLYVPRYLIEGDAERGIEALAPDLKTVEDLKKYAHLFPDDEDPGMGAIVNAPPAWSSANIIEVKFDAYNLGETYNLVSSGSDSGLTASLAAAYEKGKPWVGYYWEPTWVSGKYDIVLLEEAPYSDEAWENNYSCAFKAVDCTITMDKASYENHPEVAEFLSHYSTTSALIGEMLSYMQNEDASIDETAEWFLLEKQDLWKSWVPAEVFDKVLASVQ